MSDLKVYDKAKYHVEGDFPTGLGPDQAYVHIGMFLGWLCDHRLLSEQMLEDFGDEVEQYRHRKITGAKLLKLAGGALVSDMLNPQGNVFAETYFESGLYLDDYLETLGSGVPTLYHVDDTWENYERLKKRIDDRYQRSSEISE